MPDRTANRRPTLAALIAAAVCLAALLAACLPGTARGASGERKEAGRSEARADEKPGRPSPPRAVADPLAGAGMRALLPSDPELGELEDLAAAPARVRKAAAALELFLQGLKDGKIAAAVVHADYLLMLERSVRPFLERDLKPLGWRLGRFRPAGQGGFLEADVLVDGKSGRARGTIGLAAAEDDWKVVSCAIEFEELGGDAGRRRRAEKIEP